VKHVIRTKPDDELDLEAIAVRVQLDEIYEGICVARQDEQT